MRITHEPSLQPIISFSPESRFLIKPAFLSSSGAVFRYHCLKESPAKKRSIKRLLLLLTTLLLLQPLTAREELTSPGNVLTLTFDAADGIPRYALSYKGRAAVLPGRLGFELKNAPRCWMASPCSRPGAAASTRPGNPSGTKRLPSETTTTNWPSPSNSRAAS